MKILKNYLVQSLSLIIIFSFVTVMLQSCQETKKDCKPDVIQAYELRINGQADSAKVLLEQIVTEDSSCALAWYELARTEQYMGIGDMQAMMSHLDKAFININKAISNDPTNTSYLYFKGKLQSFDLYVKMMKGGGDVTENLQQLENTFLKVLTIEPKAYGAKLSLVELFYFIPPDMGGDSIKAEKYAQELESEDLVYGAKAREILMPEDADYIAYWTNLNKEHNDNAELIEALGRIYLFENDPEKAWENFDKALRLDESKNYLYIEMGRFYTMQAMQGQISVDSAVPLIVAEYDNYLESQPEPCNPMKAWTKGQMAMLNFRTGNEDSGNALLDEAKELDPYFSRAFGFPDQILFVPPDATSYSFSYLSRPF